jgi:hypothetical protein
MPKKSGHGNGNGNGSNHEDFQPKGHANKQGHDGASGGNVEGRQDRQDHQERQEMKSAERKGPGFNSGAGSSDGSGNAFNDMGKLLGDQSKSGCLPKLFMLFVPLMSAGILFYLKA